MTLPEETLSRDQIRAARALLAMSQSELADAARVATSTLADFERGFRTPVANNIQAIREAIEARGLLFTAGGVVEKAMLPPAPAPPRPGALVRWIDATSLSQWGEQRDGQSGMPELLSRLIFATLGPAAAVRFPSDESVQYPGWDGICAVGNGAGMVPDGESVWEIGAQRTSIRAKAEDDFVKRTAKPLGRDPKITTFVFVTPQRFVGKDDWVAEKRKLGVWRDVVALDSDDLVHWLEQYPAVAQWLAVRIGRRPQGLRNLEEMWTEWVRATETPLTEEVVLTGREDDQTAILKWLRGPPEMIAIQAEAPDEAMAFLYAAISPLPGAYRRFYASSCVVADNPETARELVGLGTPLIIVLTDPDAGLARRLVNDGHHVYAAYGPAAAAFGGARRLARPWKFDLQLALGRAGLNEMDAHRYAHLSGRSITVLRRMLPAAPSFRPAWADPALPELIAAMFAGAWVESSARDRKIIGRLAGRPYEDVEAVLARLASVGGPLVRAGEVWKVVSLRDLWTQIAGQVTTAQMARFETVFQSVLGEINPRFAKRPKSPYYEEEGEFAEAPTGALRQGLTEALIAMAVYPDRAALVSNLEVRVHRMVAKLLDQATPALWWSLSRDFHNIAEAAPKAFLDALDGGLEGDDPSVMSLFRSDEGMMTPTEYLSNLLWSLEMLARSPDYLMQAALLLAHLDEVDPGGRMGNRPGASLRRIFVTWSPQTYATPAQRLKVIDRIVKARPTVGWKLLLALAPRFHDTSEPSSKPNWRDFSPDEPEAVTWASVGVTARGIGDRLLAEVGRDGERWRSLLDHWASFDKVWRAKAAPAFQAYAEGLNDADDIEVLRDKLRELIAKHRGFAEADWAMAEEDLAPLDAIFESLQAPSVENRVRWLFRPGAASPRPGISWTEQKDELQRLQTEAADALVTELSPDALFAFAETVTSHHALGTAIAGSQAPDAVKDALMTRGLLADEANGADTAFGILVGLMLKAGEGSSLVKDLWARAIAEGWGERAETRIIRVLPSTSETWAEIEARSEGLTRAYWKTLSEYHIPADADPAYVVDHLLAVGRAHAALAWLGNHIETKKPPSDLVVRALTAAAKADDAAKGNDATMLSHWVGICLSYLETDPTIPETEIVSLEWVYFQVLRFSERPARTLHRALAKDPTFFTSLLKLIYLPAADSGVTEPEPEDMEQLKNRASQAYDVLHEWKHVPGADNAGVIDPEALEAWVKSARKQLAEAGRGEIGDSKIGEILSAAQRVPEQSWPPEPVREVIETARSRALERGLEIGVYNRRGVTTRMPHDGGDQERNLADRYRRDAEALRFDWPRTAAVLDRIADTYVADAKREDVSAEQRDWL